MADKIMLLDGHSLMNRAFYGLPNLTNAREALKDIVAHKSRTEPSRAAA